MQLLLGEGGAGLRGERGEEQGRVQGGEERRVRAGAQTPLSDPEIHGKGGHTRHRRCRGGVWEKTRKEQRRQLATSRPGSGDLHNSCGGETLPGETQWARVNCDETEQCLEKSRQTRRCRRDTKFVVAKTRRGKMECMGKSVAAREVEPKKKKRAQLPFVLRIQ